MAVNRQPGSSCSGICCTKIENFGVTIGRNRILENVNLHIHCGELTALVGPNGAGKSTLLKAILGEVQHTGVLHYLDEKGKRSDRPLIGYVPQQLGLDRGAPASVLDLYIAGRTAVPAWLAAPKRLRKRAEECLARAGAEKLLDRRLGALSGGELQRVLLALALDPVPDLLLLDEPVSGVDMKGLEQFYETVSDVRSNYDLSIILVSHDLGLVARFADRVILLNGSVILNGTPQDVFSDKRTLELFGMAWLNGADLDGKKGGNADA